jgi:hypothetical protein
MRWFIASFVLLAFLVPAVRAEDKSQQLTLRCYDTLSVQMSSKKNIVKLSVQDDTIVSGPTQLDTPTVVLTGLAAGKTQVTLTDADGKRETYQVTVQKRQFTVTVGQTIRIRMSSKKPIAKVFNEKPGIVRISTVQDDPTTIQVTGLAPGMVRITLVDGDGREEVHEAGPPLDKK